MPLDEGIGSYFVPEPNKRAAAKVRGLRRDVEALKKRPLPSSAITDFEATRIILPLFTDAFSNQMEASGWGQTQGATGYLRMDANSFCNHYFVNDNAIGTAHTAADGDWISWVVNLGPRYSRWQAQVVALKGPDCGKVDMALTGLDYHGTSGPYEPGAIPTWSWTGNPSNSTYYHVLSGGTHDLYNASQTYNNVLDTGGFILDGQDGDLPTGAWAYDATLDGNINGSGAAKYRFSIRVNTKNASSSGYKAPLQFVELRRLDANAL